MVQQGELLYKKIKFDFILEGSTLTLHAKEDYKKEFRELFWEPAGNGAYTIKTVYFEEEYLLGKDKNTFETVVMIIYNQQFFHNFMNNDISLEVDVIFNLYRDELISQISFEAKEIDYIYNITQAIDIENDYYKNGEINLKLKDTKKCESREIKFNIDKKEIICKFSILRKRNHGINRYPIEINSIFSIYFEPTKDYIFILRVYKVVKYFFQYLCFRKNIDIESVDIYCKYKENLHQQLGTINFIKKEVYNEEKRIIESRYIPFELIENSANKILQAIADDKLYRRHIPKTYSDGTSENEATFVMLVAAFEWEFKQLFKNGLPHSESTINVQNKIKNNIKEILNNKDVKGKERKIYKNLLNFIDLEGLSEKIIYTCKTLNSIIIESGKKLYKLNNQELNYIKMGDRLSKQRNYFAHGDIDKDFIEDSLLDLIFLKEIIYAMQLKRFNVPDDNIKKCIRKLFYGRSN